MMNEQEKNERIEQIRARMTGDRAQDIAILEEEIRRIETEGGNQAIAEELLQIAYGMIPPEDQEYLQKALFIDGKRLNQVYAETRTLMQQGNTAEAIKLSRALYEHILMHFRESDQERFFSFRNPFESNLYHIMYHPTKKLLKAPFDFSLYIGAHAYNLIETRRAPEAIPVLKEAIRYNPVNPDPRFELAEVYKALGQPENLLETICDTLPLCTSAYAIARCYANLGFWAVEIKDYDSAVRFYYESLNFADHPAIPGELKHIEVVSGKPLVPPTKEMINAAFAKYEIYHGPGQEVLHVARSLAKQAEEAEQWREAAFYLNIVVSLIRDDDAQNRLNAIVMKMKAEEE